MKSGAGNSIVNVASLATTYGMANILHYTMSQAAVINLTCGLASDASRMTTGQTLMVDGGSPPWYNLR